MPETIRVVYLVSRYPAVNHTFILREIVALRALGFDVQVVAVRGADRPADEMTATERQEQARTINILPAGGPFFRAQVSTLLRNPIGYLSGFFYALGMASLHPRSLVYHAIYFMEAVVAGDTARRGGYRHIHTHFASTVALIAARVFRLNLSITIHGPDEFREVIAFRMREKVAQSLFISTISNYARSQIMMASNPADWEKIHVCRLGVDPAAFVPAARPERSAFRVICVGRLAAVKAQRLLMAACGQLMAAGWDLKLHLVGSGPDRAELEGYAAATGTRNGVVFEGPRNQEEVIALYRDSDVFALASFAEGIPVVLMEAMSMELPCVATWVNGIPELIHHGEEGLLVSPSDVAGLAAGIERLLRDADERRRLGKAGRERVLREYDLAKNSAILADVFRRYLNH